MNNRWDFIWTVIKGAWYENDDPSMVRVVPVMHHSEFSDDAVSGWNYYRLPFETPEDRIEDIMSSIDVDVHGRTSNSEAGGYFSHKISWTFHPEFIEVSQYSGWDI